MKNFILNLQLLLSSIFTTITVFYTFVRAEITEMYDFNTYLVYIDKILY